MAQEIKARIDKWDCIKSKSFFTGRNTITKIKKQPKEQRKIFTNF
jgi:hypothetical protein